MADRVLVRNASDEEQVKKASKKLEDRHQLEVEDVGTLLKQGAFIRFVARYIEKFQYFTNKFGNVNEMYYLDGQRSVIQSIVDDVRESDPAAFGIILKEMKNA